MMKCQQGRPRRSSDAPDPSGPNANNDPPEKNEEPVKGQAASPPMTASDFRNHLEGLRGISAVASKLFVLLGEQITSASHTIPVERGHEMLKDLKAQARAQRDGLKTAFNPLRGHIAEMKAGFWDKHGERLEAAAHKYIQQKIRQRVLLEINKRLKRYYEILQTNEAKKKELEEILKVIDARSQNSLLRIQHPQEAVTWIGDLPDWTGPPITFDQLRNADRPSMLILAKSLGLSPAQEDERVEILNSIMKNLGIAYRGLRVSWKEIPLVPTNP